MRPVRALFTFATILLLAQCRRSSEGLELDYEISREYVPASQPAEQSEHVLRARACEAKLRQVLAQDAAPGAPRFNSQRLPLLAKAKAEPVLLVDEPEYRDAEPLSIAVQSFRTLLQRTKHPWSALQRLLPHFAMIPKEGRQTLLKDGYLYADDPDLAHAIVSLVSAEHLFGHDEIWVQRGEQLFYAKRQGSRYVLRDGPDRGEPLRLLLLDRVGHGPPPEDSLVRDLRALKYQLHFDQVRLRHVTTEQIVADLRYEKVWVPSVLRSNGARVELECQILSRSMQARVDEIRAQNARRQAAIQALRQPILEQVKERIPFDEPRREYGLQLDGVLRGNWRHAYLTGKNSFAYNGDRYYVFNREGRPYVPQVCVDFLTDTFERLSGTWWNPKGQPRGRSAGKLDYNPSDIVARAQLRKIPGFLEHVRAHPERFELLEIPARERIELGEQAALYEYLTDNQSDYQPGDMVIIRGRTPRDPVEMHYHSFFIYDSDPVTGFPIALAGNAGRASVRVWETEAGRTPKRSIWYRVRPKTEWLESLQVEPLKGDVTQPPPLSPPGNTG